MRPIIVAIILLFTCSSVYAIEKMSEPEMKDATAQLASVVGDMSTPAGSAPELAGSFGPVISPVASVINFYILVSPQVDPVLHMQDASGAAQPVIQLFSVGGDVLAVGGLF